jgi:regulator of ribonuclease activity B
MSDPGDREMDDQVLGQLSDHGDAGAIPRPVFVWIYGSESDLQTVAARMSGSGWQVELEDQDEDWLLKGQREQAATREAIYAMSDEVLAALEGTAAEYDGWETSVEHSN